MYGGERGGAMPKVTVYVPDGLLERVRKLDPEVNMSQLFQNAVDDEIHRLETRQKQAAAIREKVDLEALRQRFQAGQATLYQEGYDWGLVAANEMSYDDFEAVRQCRWAPDEVWKVLLERDFDVEDLRDDATVRGIAAALRDVWETVSADINDPS
jgi:hypothetical protein